MSESDIINNLNNYILNYSTNFDESTVDLYNRWIHDNNIVISNPEFILIILEQINALKRLDKQLMAELI